MANGQTIPQDNSGVQNTPTSVATGISAEPIQPNSAPITGVSNPPDNGNVNFVDNPDYNSKNDPANETFSNNPGYNQSNDPSAQTPNDNRSDLKKATDVAAQQHAESVPWAGWKEAGLEVAGIPAGVGEGIFSTLAGASDVSRKIVNGLSDSLHLTAEQSDILRVFLGSLGALPLVSDAEQNKMNELAGQGEQGNAGEDIGYGGETLAEFILADYATKALPVAQRMEVAAKAIKTIEGSPRLSQALKFGTRMLSLAGIHGTEAGLVQGTQATLRTPGTLEEKAKTGLKQGAEVGILTGIATIPSQLFSSFAGKTGNAAEAYHKLESLGANGPNQDQITNELSDSLKVAYNKWQQSYEDLVRDPTNPNSIEGRLGGTTIDAKNNPMALKATELLKEPIPNEHPTTTEAKELANEQLSPKTQKLLQGIASGEVPIEAAEKETGTTLLDQYGNEIKGAKAPTTKPRPPYTIHDLIETRQALREAANNYDYKNVNAYVLRQMNKSIDSTIDELAQQANDPSVLTDYKTLRANYADTLNAFENPVIKNFMNGDPKAAINQFITFEKANSAMPASQRQLFNFRDLHTILGDDGTKAFGKAVFNTMLKGSFERIGTTALPDDLMGSMKSGRFNPAKFNAVWDIISPQSKAELFNVNDVQNGMKALATDVRTAGLYQKLLRVGAFGGLMAAGHIAGKLAGGHPYIGMSLGAAAAIVAGEGPGYMGTARNLLDYVALHPAAWKGMEAVGKIAGKGTGIVPSTAAAAGVDLYNRNKENLKNSLNATQGALSNQ